MAARPEASTPTDCSAAGNGPARRLLATLHAKPWGATDSGLWQGAGANGQRIGEIHHGPADADPLLIKTLFTTDRLSVQVHPDARAAAALGHAHGKDEAWVVLAATPGAEVGIGLAAPCAPAELRAAALDGSILDRLAWHPCRQGDVFFTPAGTIHAIGAGVTMFEIQQNLDLTYRLFDYGRGRELHLDAGLAVADLGPWQPPGPLPSPGPGRELLVAGASFVVERVRVAGGAMLRPAGDKAWLAVVAGDGAIDGMAFARGEVWTATAPVPIHGDAELLLAYPGPVAAAAAWQPA